jgi:hypothetical protein
VTGIGHFSKQNLYLFILKRCQINWLVWGEDEFQQVYQEFQHKVTAKPMKALEVSAGLDGLDHSEH